MLIINLLYLKKYILKYKCQLKSDSIPLLTKILTNYDNNNNISKYNLVIMMHKNIYN
jgi:hypothetical protein